ncbi:MAG: hypothetical protein R6X14_07380 [bacterium]
MIRQYVLALFLTVLLAGTVPGGLARAQVPVWQARWNPGFYNWAEITDMALTPGGDVVATGFSQVTWNTFEFATVKFTGDSGQVAWAKRHHVLSGSRDEPAGIAVDSAGNAFVCGMSVTRTPDSTDWVVLKYDTDGNEEWSVRYHHLVADAATAVVPDQAGGCFVAGQSTSASGQPELVVARYDSDGNASWLTRLAGETGGGAGAAALAAGAAGEVYAAGWRWTGATDKEAYWLVKLDGATGDTTWTRTYNGAASPWDPRDDRAHAVTVGPDGSIYVTGQAGEYGTWYDATTVAWDADGNERWVHRFDAGRLYEDGAGEVAAGADGHVYCGGYTFDYEEDSDQDFLVYRIRPDGETDWFRVWDGGLYEADSCTGIALDAYGNVYATGVVTEPTGAWDWMIVKYNPAGQEVWRTTVGVVDEDDNPSSILLDGRGGIYVGGMDLWSGSEDFAVWKFGQQDAAAIRVLSPLDTLRVGAEVRPRVWVRNNSPVPASFPAWCYVGNFYFDVRMVEGLAAGDSLLVEFRPWEVRDVGDHEVLFFTALAGDHEPGNDSLTGRVTTVPAWEPLAPMPYSATNRARDVRDGGALAFADDSLVYAFKGNNTSEFYLYNTLRDTWVALETLPDFGSSGRRRRVRRGARLSADGQGRVYALKGNNTLEFWRYASAGDSAGWAELAQYPVDATGKTRRVRGGTGLEYVPAVNRVYSAKGSNTLEFYAYDVAADSWLRRADVLPGPRGRRAKYGTCMVYDGDNTIYLLKGGYQEFAAYSISGDTWVAKPDLPYSEQGRRRKVKKGAGMAWDPVNERLYAAKGGKSTEWWYFDIARDAWVEIGRDTIPLGDSRRPPNNGSAMTMGDGKVYLLKGNKTPEFWRYHANFPLNPGGGMLGGPMARPAALPRAPELTAAPNPFAGRAELRFSLPQAGRARLVLYDVAGRVARRLLDEERPAGSHRLTLSSAGLARGVYLARLTLGLPGRELTAEQKILIAK